MKKQRIFICSKCGSTNLKVTSKTYLMKSGIAAESGELGVFSGLQECSDCNYVGPPLETDSDKIKDIKNKLKEKEEIKIEKIKDKIKNKIVALASITLENKPHTIAVEVNDVEDNKIIITDNQMKNTPKLIKKNPNVSLVFWEGKKGEERGWRINGKAEYHDSGKWLDFVKGLKENKGYLTKGAIVIKVEEIKELG